MAHIFLCCVPLTTLPMLFPYIVTSGPSKLSKMLTAGTVCIVWFSSINTSEVLSLLHNIKSWPCIFSFNYFNRAAHKGRCLDSTWCVCLPCLLWPFLFRRYALISITCQQAHSLIIFEKQPSPPKLARRTFGRGAETRPGG